MQSVKMDHQPCLCVVTFAPSLPAQSLLAVADKQAIETKVVELHEAWNHHDMAAYTSYMADDVQWINVTGDWWKDKTQVFQTSTVTTRPSSRIASSTPRRSWRSEKSHPTSS
jgi:hypothetical protein